MPASDRKQAQETLGWSERRLRQLVEKVEDYAILITNLEGNIEAWNIGAQRLFGFTAEEAIGQYEGIIFTPEDRAEKCARKGNEKGS
jgi:PAS domain S-box-containing protein